jgi:uncharacterized protein (DUF952 family)
MASSPRSSARASGRRTSVLVFKIVTAAEWQAAEQAGVFTGSAVDARDGFIHLSTAGQVRETAARHFAAQPNLLLVAFEAAALGPALKWETSRGGARFPHLYGALDPRLALWAKPLPLDAGRAHIIPLANDRG